MPYTPQDLEFVNWIQDMQKRFQKDGKFLGEFRFAFYDK